MMSDSPRTPKIPIPLYMMPRVFPYQKRTEEPFKQDALVGKHPDPGVAPHKISTLQEVRLLCLPMATEQPKLHFGTVLL